MTTTTKAAPRRPFQRAPKEPTGPVRGTGANGAPGADVAVKRVAAVEGLTIGGEPRVHLLPPQVLARKKGKAVRRRLGLGVVGVLVLVGVAAGLADVASISAQSALTSAQAETTQILQQQAKYGDVLKIKGDSSSILAAQKETTSQEILWNTLIQNFQKTLPAGATITSINASIDNPGGAAATTPNTSADPLATTHIATVTASVQMQQPQIAPWLLTLPNITGYVDATPNSVTNSQGIYTVAITLHINSDALANRFTKAAGQ